MIALQGLYNYSHCCALQDMVSSAESKIMPPSFWTKPRIAWGSVLYASIFVLFKPSGILTESWLLPCPWGYIDSLLPTFLFCYFFFCYIECWHSMWNLAMYCWLNMLFANCKNGPSHELPTFFFFFMKLWELSWLVSSVSCCKCVQFSFVAFFKTLFSSLEAAHVQESSEDWWTQ